LTHALILARGGSKGIPNKNLAIVNGKPLLQWSIEAALNSQAIDKVLVSSDDDKILEFTKMCGANPIHRPANLATGTASSESGWLHALSQQTETSLPNLFFALQATSPFRSATDLDTAYNMFLDNSYDSLFSAELIKDHYIWRNTNGDLLPDNFDYEKRGMRQELKNKYLENGSFYILNTNKFIKSKKRHFGKIGVYEMPKHKSFQIDEPNDLRIAESLMNEFG
jgi:N-acylneuraminate cytidylyltransferase